MNRAAQAFKNLNTFMAARMAVPLVLAAFQTANMAVHDAVKNHEDVSELATTLPRAHRDMVRA